MAILSSPVIIASLSLIHLTVAYFLYTSPRTIGGHGSMILLGQSVKLGVSPLFSTPSSLTSLLAAFFALLGVSDLFGSMQNEEIHNLYWGSQAAVRTMFFFLLTAWCYLSSPRGAGLLGGAGATGAGLTGPVGMADGFIYAWAFLEAMMWFWIFIVIRDERKELAMKAAEAQERERRM